MADPSILDLFRGGDVKGQLLKLIQDVVSDDSKQELLKDLADGKAVEEFHTKSGDRFSHAAYEKRECLLGHMTLPENGNWTCYAIWHSPDALKTFQGNFRVLVNPDPDQTGFSLTISSPPGSPAATFTVVNTYFKFDHDWHGAHLSIAGELGASYVDKGGHLRTIKFTTRKRNIL